MALRQIARASVGFLFLVAAAVANRAEAQNWDGAGQLRFGVFLQQSLPKYDVVQTTTAGQTFNETAKPDGIGIGFSGGYDIHIWDRWVLGAEADFAFDNGNDRLAVNGTDHYGVDYMGTVRGRLGFEIAPKWLVYGTVGLGYMGAKYINDVSGNGTIVQAVGTGNKRLANLFGVTYGGGLEYDMGWGILFGEYLHADYSDWSFTGLNTATTIGNNTIFTGNHFKVSAEDDAFRLGLKFKVLQDFDLGDYPGPARR